ncbi:hypothetical protein FQN52_004235 [Onygenales sp. PD_12]|nr:hypothetical protein FQN52_004235 [Onygenales sp. PD_12]
MAIPGAASGVNQKPDLEELIDYLRGNLEGNKLLIIPLNTVNGFLQSFSRLEEDRFSDLVALFDGGNKQNCSRLDAVSFHCMLHILLRAPPCLARERGLYLFLKSMRDLTDTIQQSRLYTMVVASRQRKSLIGQKAFQHLFQIFANGDGDAPRRWSGQFILELIRKSQDKGGLFASGPRNYHQKLGEMVLGETDFALRLLAATIIQDMTASQHDIHMFWPSSTPQPTIDQFSSWEPTHLEWMEKFSNLISRLDMGRHRENQSMQIAQAIDAGMSKISRGSCSIGVVVSDALTIILMEDTRFRFIDIDLDHVNRHTPDEQRAILDVVLQPGGCFITNGRLERVERVSIVFERRDQVVKAHETLHHARNSPQQAKPAATGSNGGRAASVQGRGVLAMPSSKHGDQDRPTTTLNRKVLKTAAKNTRRKPSYAAMSLPGEEEVLNGFSSFPEFSSSNSPAEPDHDNQHPVSEHNVNGKALQIPIIQSIVEGEPEQSSLMTRVDETPPPTLASKSLSNQKEQKHAAGPVPNAVNPESILDQESINGVGGVAVEPHPSQTEGDFRSGLSNMARKALLLQLEHSDLPTEGPARNARTLNDQNYLTGLVSNQTSLIAVDRAVDAPQPMDAQLDVLHPKQTNIPVVSEKMEHHNEGPKKGTSKTSNEPNEQEDAGSNSKLKRPYNRISGPKGLGVSVDWDQDLRVDEVPEPTVASTSKKQKKTPPQPKKSQKPAKIKSVSRSAGKKQPQRALPLTPHIDSGPSTKSKTKRASRQITKTLTSARQRRAAAEKANQKLALANEYENAQYDPDDPIESSPPGEPILTSKESKEAAETTANQLPLTSKQQITSQSAGGDVREDIFHSSEGLEAPNKGGVAVAKEAPENTGNQISASQESLEPEGFTLPQFLPQEDDNIVLDFLASSPLSIERNVSVSPADMDKVGTSRETHIQPQPNATEVKEKSLGKRLAEALANAGILPPTSVELDDNINEENDFTPMPTSPETYQNPANGGLKKVSPLPELQPDGTEPNQGIKTVSQTVRPRIEAEETASDGNARQNEVHLAIPVSQPGQTEEEPEQPTETSQLRSLEASDQQGRDDGQRVNGKPVTPAELVPRKVQLVSFGSNGPHNQGAVSNGKNIRSLQRSEAHTNDTVKNIRTITEHSEKLNEPRSEEDDDMDAVFLVPGGESPYMVAKSQSHDDMELEIGSSSVCELTEAEFLSREPVSQSVAAHSQRVDENGSPYPIRRGWPVKRIGNNHADVELSKSSIESSSPRSSYASSGEQARPNSNLSASAGSGNGRRHAGHEFNTQKGRENSNESGAETRPQGIFSPKTANSGNITIGGCSRAKGSLFRRVGGHSSFAERLRGEQKQTNSKIHLHGNRVERPPPRMGTPKPNITPFIESSSRCEFGAVNGEDEKYDVGHRFQSESEGSSESFSSMSDTLVEGNEDVELEWQRALRATQKTSLDILLDASNRLVRNLLEEEEAIARVIESYRNGGFKLIDRLGEAHNRQLQDNNNQLQPVREELAGRYRGMAARLDSDKQSLSKHAAMKALSAGIHKRKKFLAQINATMGEYDVEE